MRSSLAHPYKPFPSIRVALIAALALLLSSWTCSAIFLSCQGVGQSQVTSLSPDTIAGDTESVLLIANGSDTLFPNRRSCGTEAHCRPRSRTHATFRPRLRGRPWTPLAAQRAVCRFQ